MRFAAAHRALTPARSAGAREGNWLGLINLVSLLLNDDNV